VTTGARLYVPPPPALPEPYGLLTVADVRDSSDPHWRAGIQWQDICGTGGTTFEYCVTSSPYVTGAPPTKTSNATRTLWGATPFTVYAEVDCSPPGFWDDSENLVRQAMERVEGWQVERAFWTGVSGGVANSVLPHLASTVQLTDPVAGGNGAVTLQLVATPVTGGGIPLAPGIALGALEQALGDCYKGQGVIHIPPLLIPILAGGGYLRQVGGRLMTWNGNMVAAGAGYPGTGPDGSTPALGHAWMYATGPVFAYRGPITAVGEAGARLIRSTNAVQVRVERTYLLGYDCCLQAVLVSPTAVVSQTNP
jgi:hypothetical protein